MRLNTKRQEALEPKRMEYAISEIKKLGYTVNQVGETELQFIHDSKGGHIVRFFPYSGWHSGSTIKDGRGIKKLLKQIGD